MASGGKKKTTFAKLAREQKLRERRQDKRARKDARRRATEIDPPPARDTAVPAAVVDQIPTAASPASDSRGVSMSARAPASTGRRERIRACTCWLTSHTLTFMPAATRSP